MYRSLPSKRKESPDNKEYNKAFNTPLTTRDKPTLLAKPYISSGKCSNLTTQIKISAVYTGNITACILVDVVQNDESMVEIKLS